MSFDDDLSGRPGLARVYNDVRQNAYDSVVSRKPEPGTNLTLTIDPNLQYEAERALAAALAKSSAKTGSIVVMNPYTGDILAMANYPTYDPNGRPDGVKETAGRAQQSGGHDSVRAGQRVQGDHARGGARNHQPDAGYDDQLRQRDHQFVRPRDSRSQCATRSLSMADVLAQIEQHRRDQDRIEGRRAEPVRVRAPVRFRPQDRNRTAGRIGGHAAPLEPMGAEFDRLGGHGPRSRRDFDSTGARGRRSWPTAACA